MISKKSSNIWYIIITILLIILILLVMFLIYLYYIKKDKKCSNDNIIIIKEKEEIKNIPVYPKELPTYNNKEYQQIGILTSDESDKEPIILPLFSRKLSNHNDRFNYYIASDKNNMMRLPLNINNQNCEDEIGCREIYDKDKITVEIYKNKIFTVTIYKKEVPKYFADKY